MTLPNAYLTSFKNTGDILKAITAAQAPDRFTIKFLEGLGYPSSNDRAMGNVLKFLGFLDDSGVPQRRYHEYLDQTQSGQVLAQGIREAYSDLFRVNKNAQNMSSVDVKNKMKTLSEGAFSDRVLTQMAGTFTTLVKFADFSERQTKPGEAAGDEPVIEEERSAPPRRAASNDDVLGPERRVERKSRLGDLVYNINIVLPESRDPAVYNVLFKALREHLGE
jgi:hypothetical protein